MFCYLNINSSNWNRQMTVYVGRREYCGSGFKDFIHPGSRAILCLTASTKYGCLSPYCLTDSNGLNMENLWQFGKIYESVPAISVPYSRWDRRVIWEYPAEEHMKDGQILPAYWNWRQKGMSTRDAVRYPVGYEQRHTCKGFVYADGSEVKILDYISARREIYVKLYQHCISLLSGKAKERYEELKDYIRKGIDITIVEVDGPKSSLLQYYRDTYGVNDDFIVENVMKATPENLEIMKQDSESPYGHGYCLAERLLSEIH